MASNIRKFKRTIHYNETQRGTIMYEDLTFSMMHEMMMKKFNLEANYEINLSFKLSSFDSAIDITDDAEVLWIQNQMLDYGFNLMNTKIYIDNKSTICIMKNLVFHSKTKQIEIRHHFIRDSYEKKLIQVIKIHINHNVADLLTKAFNVGRFNFLVASIRLLNL
nr:putative ribonuclease H-like domain-containing protein [Tanacetum cinerariifolium]